MLVKTFALDHALLEFHSASSHGARSIWDKFTGALDGHINAGMTVNATGNVACDQSARSDPLQAWKAQESTQ